MFDSTLYFMNATSGIFPSAWKEKRAGDISKPQHNNHIFMFEIDTISYLQLSKDLRCSVEVPLIVL